MRYAGLCVFIATWVSSLLLAFSSEAQDLLPSWRDGTAKHSIIEFVQRVTNPQHVDFVPRPERIAVFDNDGTLWPEQPMYVQLAFALDRVRALAAEHPEWKEQQPFKAVLENNLAELIASGERGLAELIMETHAGLTTDQFSRIVADWIAKARHPKYDRPYTQCVYQPMLELLELLRTNGFKVYIVSGGGVEFIRPWAELVYGIGPEQVIGSSIKLQYEVRQGEPVLVRLAEIEFIDDRAGKPVGIHSRIGRRPLIAVGNSDGDYEMLDYVTSGSGPRLGVLIHHNDADREFAYDRDSSFGRLDRALADAPTKQWLVVDMKDDWNQIFPFQSRSKTRNR